MMPLPLVSSTVLVFLSVLCDNLLLTVVVPILPEILREQPEASNYDAFVHGWNATTAQKCLQQLLHLNLLKENTQLGLLFSTKAIVQLLCNPLVGNLTFKIGCKLPLCIGNFILFLCSIVFGFADSYGLFLLGRSFHGLASALIMISGMALVASEHTNDSDRTQYLGKVMGAAALGVLIGYPFGGFTFALFGKSMPFITIALLAFLNCGLQTIRLNLPLSFVSQESISDMTIKNPSDVVQVKICGLLKDKSIFIITVAVWLSTLGIAVLEPTLPIWLIDKIDPPKWQLGLVFVPDSLGYFLGANFTGEISRKFGRWKLSMGSLAMIGIACFALPMASTVWQLAMPHFFLGTGLGIIDASLMPLLARLADERYEAGYGAVYALAQTSVALAYSTGPIIGGELVPVIGFADLMRCIGFVNLLYCPFMTLLMDSDLHDDDENDGKIMEALPLTYFQAKIQPMASKSWVDAKYQRFHDELDSD